MGPTWPGRAAIPGRASSPCGCWFSREDYEVVSPTDAIVALLALGAIRAAGVEDVPVGAAIMTCCRVMACGASSSSKADAEVGWLSPVSPINTDVKASRTLLTFFIGARRSSLILLSEMTITSASLLSASDNERRLVVSMLQSKTVPSMMKSSGLWSMK